MEIRVQDYRDLDDGPFDAISSVGMAEHVGTDPYREYAEILRAWAANLAEDWSTAVRLTSPDGARVWRLSMAAALAFERSKIGVNQVLAVKTHRNDDSEMPATRQAFAA